MCVPGRLKHLGQASITAQLSTAFLFKGSTRSNGGEAGEEALWSACRDCKQTVKHVQEAWPPVESVNDLCLAVVGLKFGVADGLGKWLDDMLAGVDIWLWP